MAHDEQAEADNVPRPLPILNPDNRAYWTGGADGKLLIFRCEDCHYYIHPPARFCPKCESRAVEPHAVSGRGTVASYTVNYEKWFPGLRTPYVLALVEIEEQGDVRLPCNIVGIAPEAVRIGMKVEVLFEQHEDIWLPLFKPVAETPHP
jgi:uncharacterized OB-fold protein